MTGMGRLFCRPAPSLIVHPLSDPQETADVRNHATVRLSRMAAR